jgi:hypothetical protein
VKRRLARDHRWGAGATHGRCTTTPCAVVLHMLGMGAPACPPARFDRWAALITAAAFWLALCVGYAHVSCTFFALQRRTWSDRPPREWRCGWGAGAPRARRGVLL